MGEFKEGSVLFPILLKLQKEIPNPEKTAYSEYTRSNFVPLPKLLAHIKPFLDENDLLLRHKSGTLIVEDKPYLTIEAKLIHESGEEYSNGPLLIPLQHNNPQGLGSATTYGRRYSTELLFGITGEDDDDGVAASRSQNTASNKPRAERTVRSQADTSHETTTSESERTSRTVRSNQNTTNSTEQPKTDRAARTSRVSRAKVEGMDLTEIKGNNPGGVDETPSSTVHQEPENSDANVGTTSRTERPRATRPTKEKIEGNHETVNEPEKIDMTQSNKAPNEHLTKIKDICPILYKSLENVANKDIITPEMIGKQGEILLGQNLMNRDELGLVKEALDI